MQIEDLKRRLRRITDTKHLDPESRKTIHAAVEELERYGHKSKGTKGAQAIRRVLWWLLLDGIISDE